VVRAIIDGSQIGDGDIGVPVLGRPLMGLALRFSADDAASADDLAVVEGFVSWSRYDAMNGDLETVITCDRFKVLTRSPASQDDPVPAPGTPIRQLGRLRSVWTYEFEAFALPDVSQQWKVLSAERFGRFGHYRVEIEPDDDEA